MGALGRVVAATATRYPFSLIDHDQVSLAFGGGLTYSGIAIGPDSALRLSAVYACTAIIAESTAALPLHIYEDLGDRGKRPAPEHPLQERLHDQPNRYQTAIEFREMMTAFALLRSAGIAEQRRTGRRGDVELIPLHPDCISREYTASGVERFRYYDPLRNGEERVLIPDDLLILRGRFGRSVLDYARDDFGLALQQNRYAMALYKRGLRSPGALTHQHALSPKARRNLRKALDEYAAGGDNEGRPLLLEEGMTWTAIGLNNEQAQFLDSRKFSVAEVARWFRVPLHKIQDLDRSTNNNIEQQAKEFVDDTMVPWCTRWEQSIRRDLIVDHRFYAKHNIAGLLRGDTESRYKAYALAIQWGWMNPNEARELEDRNPYAGGDLYQRPLNMERITGDRTEASGFAYIDGGSGRVISLDDTTRSQLRVIVKDAAARAARKETAAIAKLAERTDATGPDWTSGVQDFYREHAEFIGSLLHVPDEAAQEYAAARCAAVLELGAAAALPDVGALTNLALERADVLRLPTAA